MGQGTSRAGLGLLPGGRCGLLLALSLLPLKKEREREPQLLASRVAFQVFADGGRIWPRTLYFFTMIVIRERKGPKMPCQPSPFLVPCSRQEGLQQETTPARRSPTDAF